VTPRRTGRPRRDGRTTTGDPSEEILIAAGRLFGQLGVEATTMSRLAAEVGLGQSSLYYYFRSRDEVVAALVARANVVPLELVDGLVHGEGSVPVKLFRFVRGDVEALCELPFDINEIHRIAARQRERFADYWQERAGLERRLTSLVRAGVSDGSLRDVDPRLATATILAGDEGTQNWFRLRPQPIGRIADTVARITVGGLVAAGVDIDDVAADA
jgi:TetR/AcrR family transcriptional regulator